MADKVMILMASYNGQAFISQQIESIIEQSYINWDLFIRDDGSTDGTVQIIKKYEFKDERIHYLKKTTDRSGACINFYELLRYAKENILDYKYFFLSDQDDIWDKNKLTIQIEAIKEQRPLLVYSDLMLMNSNGSISNKKMSDIHDIFIRNKYDIFYNQIFIWGNTIGLNRELLNLVNIPKDISNELSHDHYLAFYGSAFGEIIFVNKPLIFYRRHEDNVSDLPPSYNLYTAFKRVCKGIRPLIDRHAQSYCNVLYFIQNAPYFTKELEDIKVSYTENRLKSVRVLKKYNIVPGSNKYNILINRLLIFTGLYKLSDNYKKFKSGA